MKRAIITFCGIFISLFVFSKPVQILVKPVAAQSSATIYDKGNPISGSNGVFRVDLGLFESKELLVQADGFDDAHITISRKHKTDNYEITLVPNRKKVSIISNVENSTIYVDGDEIGKGMATFNIYKNTRKSVKILADGYDTYTGTVSFNDSRDLAINKDCTLYPNRKEVSISVLQNGAIAYGPNGKLGTITDGNPLKLIIHKGKPIMLRISCEGFIDVFKRIEFEDENTFYNLGSMPVDDGYMATDFHSSDIANKVITIKVREGMDRDAALTAMKYYITNDFRNLEVNDNLAGWIRTQWNIDKFTTMTIRTRIELKQIPFDGDGLKFNLLVETQKAAPDAGMSDEEFSDWEYVLKKYKKLPESILKSVN